MSIEERSMKHSRGRLIAPSADLSAPTLVADKSALGAINRPLQLAPLWLCLLIALALRIWLVVHTNGVIDGDEALVGIQAERVLHGDFPIYFYGQAYMGSLEVYLIAIIFAITGPSVWALRTEPIILSLVLVWLTWKLAAALADAAHLPAYAKRYFMIIAALLAAVPPLYDGVIEMRTYGGYIETFIIMLLLLLSALRLTQRWYSSASTREIAWRWAGIGFLVGLGLWIYPLIAPGILTAALWMLANCVAEIFRQRKLVSTSPIPATMVVPRQGTRKGYPYYTTTRVRTSRIVGVPLAGTLGWGEGSLLHPLRPLLLAVVAIPTCMLGLMPALIWGAT